MEREKYSINILPVANFLLASAFASKQQTGEALAAFLKGFGAEAGIASDTVALILPEKFSLSEGFIASLKACAPNMRVKEYRCAPSVPSEPTLSETSSPRIPPAGAASSKTASAGAAPAGTMGSVCAILEEILGEHPDMSAVFHFWGDAPFMNVAANREILDLHRRYLSDYVFAEGYPAGITGSILTREILAALKHDGGKLPIQRNGIFETVRVNINAYDIETAVSPRDLRMLRLELFTDVQRNIQICEKLPISPETEPEELCRIINEQRPAYRSLPSFFAFQLSARCPQTCSYCPFPLAFPGHREAQHFLAPDAYLAMLDKVCAFVEDPVISLSLWGEVSLHPQLDQILRMAQNHASARFLIETSGIGWTEDTRKQLAQFAQCGPAGLNVILSLDSIDPALYKELRGEGFEEAMDFARWAGAALGDHFYVQAVRMNENEEHLMEFYRHWKSKGVQFIIQKYNDHSGYISQKRVADLAPLKRHECWHIKRDMLVDISGRVFACANHSISQKDDLSYGNLLTDDIDKIWARGEKLFASDLNNTLPKICKTCDEWYTYNF